MGYSIGIDLGTTNSVGAHTTDGRNPIVITTRERGRATPSVVARQVQGDVLVGAPAIRYAMRDPINVVSSIKRLMGRRYDDEEVGLVRQHVNYRIVPANGAGSPACVMLGEQRYSPIEISALVLESIKKDAELALGGEVTHAVITVPAYFDDSQREATRQAGGRAGLKVKRIIDEPTAAAYAYGMGLNPDEGKTILVYDLGGGTFDISVIFISDGIPTVENIEGDVWLGGDRFDHAIMDYVIDELQKEYPGTAKDLRADPEFMLKLKLEAETAKKNLNQAHSTDIVMWGQMKGRIDVNVTIAQAEFERRIRKDIENSMVLVDRALAVPNFTPADIDHVLLVGGSTALPLVRTLLVQKFGAEKIRATVDPMECVALGAAILASRTENKYCVKNHENEPDAKVCAAPNCGLDISDAEPQVKCPHCGGLHSATEPVCQKTGLALVADGGGMTSKHYGIGTVTGKFEVIVEKGTHYPTTEPIFKEFRTVADAQERIVFPIYQGFEEEAAKNELQMEIVIPESGEIPADKRVPAGTPLDIGFSIDRNGQLTVEVRGKGALSWLKHGSLVYAWDTNRRPKPLDGGGSDTVGPTCPRCQHANKPGVRTCSECGEAIAKRGPDGPQDPEWKRELMFPLAMARAAVNEYAWALKPDQTEEISKVVQRAERALKANDEATCRLVKSELEDVVAKHCGKFNDLLIATCIYNGGIGRLDQKQRLGSLLQEFKRRFLAGEDQNSAGMQELRNVKIAGILEEILGGLGQGALVPCQGCHKEIPKPTKSNPKCPKCGYNHFGVSR
jgi:molecular chaperone DnaK